MDARALIEPKFLKSAQFGVTLPAQPLLTITKIEQREETSDGETELWALAHFKEPGAKPLKLNPTNRDCLIAMFGLETDNWIGKRVRFFAMPGKWFGEPGTAVRINGSPDIKAALSVSVKMRGGKGGKKKSMIYEIAALPGGAAPKAPAAAAAPAVEHDPSTHVIFKRSPLYGKALAELDVEALAAVMSQAEEMMALGDTLKPEQRERLGVAVAAIKKAQASKGERLPAPESATAPVQSPKTAPAPKGDDLDQLMEALDHAEIPYQGDRLEREPGYAAAKRLELESLAAKRAAAPAAATPAAPPVPVAAPPAAAPAATGPVVIFGELRGRPISSLSGVELVENIALGEAKISSLAPEKRPPVRACIDAMAAAKSAMDAKLFGDSPEPGSEG